MISTVDASTLRNHLRDVIEEVIKKKDYILVTRKHKPITAIVNLDFLEDLLALSSHEYGKSIREAREDYKHGKISTHKEIFGRIG